MKSILTILFSFLFIVSGFSQTRNVVVDTNGVVVQPTNIWTANATNARSGLGLGSAATNPASAFQPSSLVLSNLASSNGVNLTNIPVAGVVGSLATNGNGFGLTNLNATNISGIVSLANGGTGATNAAQTRTNLGLGWSALTNTNSSIGLVGFQTNGTLVIDNTNSITITNPIVLGGVADITTVNARTITLSQFNVRQGTNTNSWGTSYDGTNYFSAFSHNGSQIMRLTPSDVNYSVPISFSTNTAILQTRTNLGLVGSWLTNTNNPVFVNTNGTVVSPTNFWQAAPIQTLVQTFTPITNSTNTATNARNLYVYSLATNVSGITNVIVLPTNTAVFAGDNATVIHRGTTNSTTAIRQDGAATNLITITNFDDAIKFIYENGSWDFYHNISFVEPIKFTDGNLEFNKATSRTNLGLVLPALTNTNNATFQEAIFTTNAAPTNAGNFGNHAAWMGVNIVTNGVTNTFLIPLYK